jgi:outer membrane immunogenic protein
VAQAGELIALEAERMAGADGLRGQRSQRRKASRSKNGNNMSHQASSALPMIQRCQITRSIACELIERSGASVNDNGTFAYEKVPRSNWNSTLILLKPEGSFHAVVASRLQQFAPALLERPHGLGAFTRNWNFGMKKKLLLVSASLIALSAAAPASAADLAARPYTKAPPMVAAIYDWTGFYIGINGGGGFSHNCWDLVPGGREGCHDASGGTVGGQIGYRWQTGPVVFGVEAQGNWADFTGDNVSALLAQRNRTKFDAFGLFTGQIGYAFNNVLLYAKGGAAVTDTKYDVFAVPGGLLLGSNSNTLGRRGRRRRRIRLRVELVRRLRVRPPVHGSADCYFPLPAVRQHQAGRRPFHRPRQLQVRRSYCCQVLITQVLDRKPRLRPGFLQASGRAAFMRQLCPVVLRR